MSRCRSVFRAWSWRGRFSFPLATARQWTEGAALWSRVPYCPPEWQFTHYRAPWWRSFQFPFGGSHDA